MIILKRTLLPFLATLGLLGMAAPAVAGEPAAVIGEISFVIGGAWRQDASGQSHALARGVVLHAGDRLETADNGHAHIQFVDGARLSLRPKSRLLIETYRYDPAAPAQSAIRFNLEEGHARSITGRGGEAARERFRLNTPLAAIGIRGTDFIVSADLDSTRVKVESGAVVVAPIGSNGCQANGFGPCAGVAARLLSAEMGGVMLEIKRQQDIPRLIPAPQAAATPAAPTEQATARPVAVAAQPTQSTPATPSTDPVASSVRPPEVASETRGRDTIAAVTLPQPVEPPTPVVPEPPVVTPPTPVTPPVVTPPVVEPTPPITSQPPPPSTLAWGRWNWAAPRNGASLIDSYAIAATGRKITVGTGEWGLFRDESAGAYTPAPQLGRASFDLIAANAWVTDGKRTDIAQVGNGTLAIDFAAKNFVTNLDVQHAEVGRSTLSVSGTIDNRGIFTGGGTSTKVAGALSVDNSEAGYQFSHALGSATFSGVTLWRR